MPKPWRLHSWTEVTRPEEARAICEPCPVRQECHDYAMADSSIVGVWAGLNEKDRKKLRAEERKAERLAEAG